MKSVIAICMLGLIAVALARPAEEHYTDKYDSVDLDEILSNEKLRHPYIKCMLDQGKCTPDGKELKSHIREALENNCGKCTDAQKEGTKKVIKYLMNHEQDYWSQLQAKYDPEGKYVEAHKEELEAAKEKN